NVVVTKYRFPSETGCRLLYPRTLMQQVSDFHVAVSSGLGLPPWIWPRAAYIHIPFCAHHCGYCDFAVVAGQDHLMDLYLDALTAELATMRQPQTVHSVFIGGGTPTYFNCRQLEKLLAELRRLF